MNDFIKFIERLINYIKEKSFTTFGTIFFDIFFITYIIAIFINIGHDVIGEMKKTEKIDNARDYTFILSSDSELRGGVKYNIYKFNYTDSPPIIKINSYFWVQKQSDNVYTMYAFNVPMSVKNEADINTYVLYQEEPSGRFYDDGVNATAYPYVQYNIIFEIVRDVSGESITQYYLLDGQGAYTKLTRQNVEKLLNSVQVSHVN